MITPEWLEPHTMDWVCSFLEEEIEKDTRWFNKTSQEFKKDTHHVRVTVLRSVIRSLHNRRTRAYHKMISKYNRKTP